MKKIYFKSITSSVLLFFVVNSIFFPISVSGQSLNLPPAGQMIYITDPYAPTILKGIKIFPQNPLRFDFILDPGDAALEGLQLEKESEKLVKYFLASLTTPENDIWVNLSPYEQNRIIPDSLSLTEMGRDMLAQDYILKQFTASLMYPEDELGSAFWEKIYQKLYEEYGEIDIPVDTFNKVWIMPQKAVIHENGDTAVIIKSQLKVMLEEDYIAYQHSQGRQALSPSKNQTSDIQNSTKHIIREVILPAIEKEVNEGKNFAELRQIYHAVILASWFKINLKNSILNDIYVDQNKVSGLVLNDRQMKEKIYNQYVQAFQKGVYNYIREEFDQSTGEVIPKKYFSGGEILNPTASNALEIIPANNNPLQDNAGAMTLEVVLDRVDSAMSTNKNDSLSEANIFGEIHTEKVEDTPVLRLHFYRGEREEELIGDYDGGVTGVLVNKLKKDLSGLIETENEIEFVFHGEAGPILSIDKENLQARVSWSALIVPDYLETNMNGAREYKTRVIPQSILPEIVRASTMAFHGIQLESPPSLLNDIVAFMFEKDNGLKFSDSLKKMIKTQMKDSDSEADKNAAPLIAIPKRIQEVFVSGQVKNELKVPAPANESLDASAFLERLTHRGNIFNFLENSIKSGEIFEFIPELKGLIGLTESGIRHQYTAEVHTMMLVWTLDEYLNSEEGSRNHPSLSALWKELSDNDLQLLSLASLFHDLAKADWGQKGDRIHHPEYGSTQIVPSIVKRLGLDENMEKDLKILVRYHHFFDVILRGLGKEQEDIDVDIMKFITILKRDFDVSDDDIIRYLKLLPLIGLADSLALDISKITLSKTILDMNNTCWYFDSSRKAISEDGLPEFEHRTMNTIRKNLDFSFPPEYVDTFLNAYPNDVVMSLGEKQQKAIIQGLINLDKRDDRIWNVSVDPYFNGDESFLQITVLSREGDRVGVLHDLSSIFSAYHLDLFRGFVISDGKGGVLDLFLFRGDKEVVEEKGEELAESVRYNMRQIHDGQKTLDQVIQEGFDWNYHLAAVKTTKNGKRIDVTTDVSFEPYGDNKSLIKIRASDRDWLLASITEVLLDLNLNIINNFIMTTGYEAADVFVVDHLSDEQQKEISDKMYLVLNQKNVQNDSSRNGGIDFNPNDLNLEVTGNIVDYDVLIDPVLLEDLIINPVDGFTPVILNISPLPNLPNMVEVNDLEKNSGKLAKVK